MKKALFIGIKIIICLLLIVLSIGAGLLLGVTAGCVMTTSPLTTEQLYGTENTTLILDSDGNTMQELEGDTTVLGTYTEISDIPENLQHAFVAIEDSRFYTHNGVDVKRTASAVLSFFIPGKSSHGGSTITQQLVKNVTGDNAKSIPRKIREQYRAIKLEQTLSKDEILELYLSKIYFGNNAYGVYDAAETYFGKNVSELNLSECAFLAGLTNNPTKYNPFTLQGRRNAYSRQATILIAMYNQGYIDEESYITAMQTTLEFATKADSTTEETPYSYFTDMVIKDVKQDLISEGYTKFEANDIIYNQGITIYTTQNTELQSIVDEVYTDNTYFRLNEGRYYEDCAQSAIIIMDQNNGQIKAVYGGYGEKTTSLSYNRATDIKRQPGSAIKPLLVYGPLIDMGRLTDTTEIDEQVAYLDESNPEKPWPSNWDRQVHGIITARYALIRSYNIPAATWFKGNEAECLSYLKNLGIDRTDEPYLSSALGGFSEGVSPKELCAAYCAIANGGNYIKPVSYTKVTDKAGNIILDNTEITETRVFKESTARTLTSMLQDVIWDDNGTGKSARITINGENLFSAGKTGTTNGNKDYWFAGFTENYTGVVWYGYDNGTAINEKIEGGSAMIIWRRVFSSFSSLCCRDN